MQGDTNFSLFNPENIPDSTESNARTDNTQSELNVEELTAEYILQVKLLFENLSEAIRRGALESSIFNRALKYVQRINRETFGILETKLSGKVALRGKIAQNKLESCAVCREEFGRKKIVDLNCKHSFHQKCIKEWAKWGNYCPLCRSSLI